MSGCSLTSFSAGPAPRWRNSHTTDTSAAIQYALFLWPALLRYNDDGVIKIDNSATECALRGALSAAHYLYVASGSESAAAMYSIIGLAELNGIDPKAWWRDVPDQIAITPSTALTSSSSRVTPDRRPLPEKHTASQRCNAIIRQYSA
ncbi:transposase [Massilia sp. CCM 8695]|uniref:Transposase n=1 Tax=Massilia frigida TaxID=2609281 RepID=A0ABX0NJT2_9BURK|nr:transposase [Massilia frigida]